MGFSTKKKVPTPAVNNTLANIQQLCTGALLVDLGLEAWILEPNQYGNFDNGSWRRVQDVPFGHLYHGTTVGNDGKVYYHGAEYGSSGIYSNVDGRTSIFDPFTEKWEGKEGSISTHYNSWLDDTGRHFGSDYTRQGKIKYIPASGRHEDMVTVTTDQTYPFYVEAGSALLPNGKIVTFGSGGALVGTEATNRKISVFNPADLTTTVYDFSDAGFPNGSWRQRVMTAAAPTGKYRTWCSQGEIDYELGAAAYMPKIGKVALVGGWGNIWTFDPSNNTLAMPAELPMTPLYSDSDHRIGVYVGVLQGTAGQLIINNASPLRVQKHAAFDPDLFWASNPKKIYVRLDGNTRWSEITFTNLAVVGNEIQLTGLTWTEGVPSNYSYHETGAEVWATRPSYDCRDAPACILPNGDLLFAAGAEVYSARGNFNFASRLMKWDGSASVASFLSSEALCTASVGEFGTQLTVLPSGEVFWKLNQDGPDPYGQPGGGAGYRIYTPTSAELTPMAGSRPVVTSFPGSVLPGSMVRLVGQQLNGLHEGAFYGDDGSPRTNFPLVRLTNPQTGKVFYCPTRDYDYRGIEPNRTSSCMVQIPHHLPPASYDMEVVASGVPSTKQTIKVTPTGGTETFL